MTVNRHTPGVPKKLSSVSAVRAWNMAASPTRAAACNLYRHSPWLFAQLS